jgi:hypothetical protein
LNDDFLDLLAALLRAGTRFLVVGAHAMAIHGVPRATGDLDVWIEPTPQNAERAWRALVEFGAPTTTLGITRADLEAPSHVVQIGVPPRRIDLLTTLSGIDFASAWTNRVLHRVGVSDVPFLARTDLIRNKRASGRPKDLADLDVLERD